MPETPEKTDPVEALRRNTKDGIQSIIHYDKQDGRDATRRVIEPRYVAQGPSGLLVRATEFEPQQGARHYKTDHIVEVEPHDVPLAEPRDASDQFLLEIPLEPMTGTVAGEPGDIDADMKAVKSDGGDPLPIEGISIVPIVPWMLRSPLERAGFNAYVDAVRDAVLDLVIDEDERERLGAIRSEWGLNEGQMRAGHARVFAEYVMGYSNDGDIDESEMEHLQQLHKCLETVGWGPGQ